MAAGFRFRLEVVRKIRKQAQDVQRREVADAVRSVNAVQGRIAALEGQVQVTVNQTRETQQAGLLDMMSLQRHHLYRGWLHRRRAEVSEELARHEEQLDKRRGRLAEATKQLKVVEKLREKQKARYDRRMQRQEQAGYDEAALQIYRGHSSRVREVGAV